MKLYHIGIVVKDINETLENLSAIIESRPVSGRLRDRIQKVEGIFLSTGSDDGVQLELLEPMGAGSPVSNFLQKYGGGIHHLCFEVEDIEASVAQARQCGARIVCRPIPSEALDGRKIAFLYLRDKVLIEFVERTRS